MPPAVLDAALRPITIGTMSLSHRLFVPTHGGGAGSITAGDDRFDDLMQYWLARVDDGFEWIGGPTGHVKHVHIPGFEPTGVGALGKEGGIFRTPAFADRMRTFVDRVHAKGAYLGVQLVQQGGMPSAPSATFSGYLDHRGVHVLHRDEIRWIVDEFIASAVMAADAGVDSIELHANHDDMMEWFMSPLTNTRHDEWGGSFERRLRFLREIVDGIRTDVGRPITLGLRLAMDQLMEGGSGLADCIDVMRLFEADGTIDYFSLDVGGNWGPVSYIQHGRYPEAHWAGMCAEAKSAVAIPVLYVGRVVHPETAERVIAEGQADMVGMVRALIADPHWLRKARGDHAEDIRPCIALNECIHRYTHEGLTFGCGVNPRAGREWREPITITTKPKRLLVVGGGPAGMHLATTAAELGHDVALWEAKPELGGRFAIAAQLRANAPFRDWIDWSAKRLEQLDVDVYLGRRASVRSVLDAGPDVVAFATGALPRPPGIPGQDLPHVVGGDAAVLGAAPLGKRVLVVAIDDGPAPMTVPDHLAGLGHEVTVVFESPSLSPLVGKYSAGAMLASLDADGVRQVPLTRVVAIRPDGTVEVANAYSGRRSTLEGFDSVVLLTGGVGDDALYRAVRHHHPAAHLLGDAFAPRRVTFATRQAQALAQSL